MAFWDFFTSPELRLLRAIDERTAKLMLDFSRLRSEVSEIRDVVGATKLLLKRLADELREANGSGNQAAINDIAEQLDQQGNELGAAVAENTPAAEPTPEPAPAPAPEPQPPAEPPIA